MQKNRPGDTFSREAFERLSHPEKLDYLTYLMDILERSRPSDTKPARVRHAIPGPSPVAPGRAVDQL